MYTVKQLKAIDISTLTITDKITLRTSGRPVPEFVLEKKTRPTRYLQASAMYYKYDWICGCIDTKSFYCFPCVLFSNQTGKIRSDAPFINVGHNDLLTLSAKIQQHEVSEIHILCLLESQSVINKSPSISFAYKQQRKKTIHNNKVCENRVLLSRLINCMKLCIFSQLSIQPLTKKGKVQKPPPFYTELLKLVSEFDFKLKNVLSNEKPEVLSSSMINEMFETMAKVTRDEITSQIQKSNFLSIHISQLDGLYTSSSYKLAMIVRYIHQSTVYERFWSFINPSEWTAKAIAVSIIKEIDSILVGKMSEKLISQSYDGCDNNYTSDGKNIMFRVQNLVQEKYKYAMYIFSYANSINSFLKRIAYLNCETKVFFINVINLKKFFLEIIFQDITLISILAKRLPRLKLENIKNGEIIIFHSFRVKIRKSFQEMRKKFITVMNNDQVVFQLDGYIRLLGCKEFIFWLSKFYKINQYMRTLLTDIYLRRKNVKYHLTEFTNQISQDKELHDVNLTAVTSVNVKHADKLNTNQNSEVVKGVDDNDKKMRHKKYSKFKSYKEVEMMKFAEANQGKVDETCDNTANNDLSPVNTNIVLPTEEIIIDMEQTTDENVIADEIDGDYDRFMIEQKDPLEEYSIDVKEEYIKPYIAESTTEIEETSSVGFLCRVKLEEGEEDINVGSLQQQSIEISNVEEGDLLTEQKQNVSCGRKKVIKQLRLKKPIIALQRCELLDKAASDEVVKTKKRRLDCEEGCDSDSTCASTSSGGINRQNDNELVSARTISVIDTDVEDDEIEENKEETKQILENIIKTVIVQVKECLTHLEYLDALILLNYNYFPSYVNVFPYDIFNNVTSTFSKFLNKKKLRTELEVLYQREEFRQQVTISNLLCYIEYNKYDVIFPEIAKLLKLVLTIPGVTYEKNVCFSSVDEIHKFLKDCPSTANHLLNWLGIIYLNSHLIERINKFDELVIDEFSTLPNRQQEYSFSDI